MHMAVHLFIANGSNRAVHIAMEILVTLITTQASVRTVHILLIRRLYGNIMT